MAVAPGPTGTFKFSADICSVKVDNVAESVSNQEIVNLFTGLIGEVRKCNEYAANGRHRYLELLFASPDTAKKALCMSGYTVAGVPISVSLSGNLGPHRAPRQTRQADTRRNLYVLGLPFDFTKSEFIETFSRYGTVSHAVILATVDNASRRRGFVVMSTSEEAKMAMNALGRSDIKGHIIDVSWAVVQRSQGFLDGGDRTMVLSRQNQASLASCSALDADSESSLACHYDFSDASSQADIATPLLPIVSCPPSSLLVSNLPKALFSELDDLHPLFCPFGDVLKLKIVDNPNEVLQGTISVIVEYKNSKQAQDARDNLTGQRYANQPIKAEFVQVMAPPETWCHSQTRNTDACDVKGLNPRAAPFSVDHSSSLASSTMLARSFYQAPNRPLYEDAIDRPHSQMSSCLSDYDDILLQPTWDTFRPRSAPLRRPMRDRSVLRPVQWPCSSSNYNLSTSSLPSTYTA